MSKLLNNYKDVPFQSSTRNTKEFLFFVRLYKNKITKDAKENGLALVKWSTGHFYCSAFFENIKTGKLVYMSCSDVRFFKNGWCDNILIRTATNDRDYTGGNNNYCKIDNIGEAMLRLSI